MLHNIAILQGDDIPLPLPDELDDHILNQLIENGQISEVNQDAVEDLPGAKRLASINDYFQNIFQ